MRLMDNGAFWSVAVSERETDDWATRPGASWPCSTLRGKRFWAQFDKRNGDLVDITVNGRSDAYDIDGHELSALLADVVNPKAAALGWAVHA